jgi:hypothetical protein
MSPTKIASCPVSAMRSTPSSLRRLQSSTSSVSSSQLSRGLRPQGCASANATSCKSRSRSSRQARPSSPTAYCLGRGCAWRGCCVPASCRVALVFAHSASKSALTLTKVILEIWAFSSHTMRTSSLWVSSSSHTWSCSSSAAIDATTTGGGESLHKTDEDDQHRIKK